MTFYRFSNLTLDNNNGITSSMHELRYKVFYEQLGWRDGLIIDQKKEFDEYDNMQAEYIADVGTNHNVQSCCRLMSTTSSYMIRDHYPDYIKYNELPQQDDVYEISRFCTDPDIIKDPSTPPAAASLTIAMLEYGLTHNITNYIALTNVNIKAMIQRIGWDPKPLGDVKKTPDGIHSVVCSYTVSEKMMDNLKWRHKITKPVLYDLSMPNIPIIEEIKRNSALVACKEMGIVLPDISLQSAAEKKITPGYNYA